MHFEKLSVPTLPKTFRPVTRNTLIFLFGLMCIYHMQIEPGEINFQMNICTFSNTKPDHSREMSIHDGLLQKGVSSLSAVRVQKCKTYYLNIYKINICQSYRRNT